MHIVGGSMVTFEEIGRKTAPGGLAYSYRRKPASCRSLGLQGIPMFDWRQLRRWNISGKQLPPSSVSLFKEATYWEKYHWLVLGGSHE